MKALAFFHYSKSAENLERILFEINVNPNVSRFSDHPDEDEILFMIESIFRLFDLAEKYLDYMKILLKLHHKWAMIINQQNGIKN